MKRKEMTRRDLIKGSVLAFGTAVGSSAFLPSAFAQACGLTPKQTEGPFYPLDFEGAEHDNDLTAVQGRPKKAEGQMILIQGKVQDQNCRAVENARVEIWQASHKGAYNHPQDSGNQEKLDPNFQYWGNDLTRADGSFQFKTIVPGSYLAGGDWVRPPHIHYRIAKRGYKELITQMYFKGHELNEKDLILRSLSPEEQKRVVIDFQPHPVFKGVLVGEFPIVFQKMI